MDCYYFFEGKKKSSYFFDVSRRNAKEQYKSNILEKHLWSQIYRVDYRLKLLIKHTPHNNNKQE